MSRNAALKKVTQKSNMEQITEAELAKYLAGKEMKCDPGSKFLEIWFKKNSKKFRKKWSIRDCKDMLKEMKVIRKLIRTRLAEVGKYTKKLEDLEDEILIDVENLEKEMEKNGNGNGK